MNKKFLMGAAIAGVFCFGSCVDNNESPSVTNIREAKAEQLKALAAMNNAAAQAAIIKANADAAAQEAIAAYNNALAEKEKAAAAYQQALAEQINAQTEELRQEAEQKAKMYEIQLQNAQIEMERAAAQLKETQARVEQQIAIYKANIALYENQLKANIADGKNEASTRLENLISEYARNATDLLTYQGDLADKKTDLLALENGLASAKETLEKALADINEQITEAQTSMDEAKAELQVYNTTTSAGQAQVELKKLEEEIEPLVTAANEAEVAKQIANTKINESGYIWIVTWKYDENGYYISNEAQLKEVPESAAWTNLTNSAYVDNVKKFVNTLSDNKECNPYVGNVTLYSGDNGIRYEVYDTESGNWNEYTIINGNVANYDNSIPYSVAPGLAQSYEYYKTYEEYYMPVKDGFKNYKAAVERSIKENQEAAVTAQKAVVAQCQTDLTAAEDAVKAAGENVPDNLKADVETAKEALKNANETLATYTNALNEANAQLEANEKEYNKLIEGVADNEANMKAFNDLSKAYAEACINSNIADYNLNVKRRQFTALKNILDSSAAGDVKDKIAELEQTISQCEEDIETLTTQKEELQEQIDNYTDDEADLAAIEVIKKQIADLQIKVDAQQKLVDSLKARLDEAMAEEETPAE